MPLAHCPLPIYLLGDLLIIGTLIATNPQASAAARTAAANEHNEGHAVTLSKNDKSWPVAGGPVGVAVSQIRVKPSQKICIGYRKVGH